MFAFQEPGRNHLPTITLLLVSWSLRDGWCIQVPGKVALEEPRGTSSQNTIVEVHEYLVAGTIAEGLEYVFVCRVGICGSDHESYGSECHVRAQGTVSEMGAMLTCRMIIVKTSAGSFNKEDLGGCWLLAMAFWLLLLDRVLVIVRDRYSRQQNLFRYLSYKLTTPECYVQHLAHSPHLLVEALWER